MKEIHRARDRSSGRIVPFKRAGQSSLRRERAADPTEPTGSVPSETRVRSRVVDIRKDFNTQRTFLSRCRTSKGLSEHNELEPGNRPPTGSNEKQPLIVENGLIICLTETVVVVQITAFLFGGASVHDDDDYLIVDPACEVNERGTRGYNSVVNNCDLPLDLEIIEQIEVDDETLHYAEEDCNNQEQTAVDKGVELDFPLTRDARQSKRGKDKKNKNPYGEYFVVDKMVLDDITDLVVGLDEIMISQDIGLVDDTETGWIDDRSEPKMESNLKRNRCMSKS